MVAEKFHTKILLTAFIVNTSLSLGSDVNKVSFELARTAKSLEGLQSAIEESKRGMQEVELRMATNIVEVRTEAKESAARTARRLEELKSTISSDIKEAEKRMSFLSEDHSWVIRAMLFFFCLTPSFQRWSFRTAGMAGWFV